MKSLTRPLLAVAALTAASSSTLSAATSFSEDFSGLSAGPNMALGTNAGMTTSFSGGNFAITAGSNRIYLGTTGTDYSTVDFTFQATVFIATHSTTDIAFFGMGSSTPNSGQFYEPLTGSNAFMVLRSDSQNIESRDNATTAATSMPVINTGANFEGTTHLLRMTWTAATKSAFFEFDRGNNGSVDNSFTVDGSNNNFNASNSQLVIGGGTGLTFDNVTVTVVPEPSTYGLIGAGALAGVAFVRRRRRHAGADA